MTRPDPASFPYRRHADQDRADPAAHPVVIVGAGLVGLTLALDLVQRGHRPVVLERRTGLGEGSRSICQAKRTLEIWDRLGAADPMLRRGVTWNVGRVFHRDRPLYAFDLLPEDGHRMPAFINLQQYLVEGYLLDRLLACGGEVRWGHAVTAVDPNPDGVDLTVDTPDGPYAIAAGYLIACDGARSPVRKLMGLGFEGRVFRDKFLIADVRMTAPFPTERWFWFEPPFHPGQTALLHRQADDVWRIDLQLGWDADTEAEKDPARVRARIAAMLGPDAAFDLEWISVYVFQCRTLDRYVHDRVLFAGDAAHQVSPFGARGGNGGVQDADNLGWKLDMVLRGLASQGLLDSYGSERLAAARENILNSTRATDFITPKTPASRALRDRVLGLAATLPEARALVNSGRLSLPCHYRDSPLNTPDAEPFATRIGPGSPATDAPLLVDREERWLLSLLDGGFTVLVVEPADDAPDHVEAAGLRVPVIRVAPACDRFRDRYDARPGTTYLFRPDQHVAARWRHFDPAAVTAAVTRVLHPPAAATDQPPLPAAIGPAGGAGWADADGFYAALVAAIEQGPAEDLDGFLLRLMVILASREATADGLADALARALPAPR